MRANKILNYESILQVLGETGCPFCRFMKNFQAALLQDPSEKDIHHFCSCHTWGLAAAQRAAFAADLFLKLLAKQPDVSPPAPCDICVLLRMEEDRRVREFIDCAQHKLVGQWLRSQAMLCMIHGTKIRHGSPPVLAAAIGTIMERRHKHLVDELTRLRDEYQPETENWGVLGQAAEFLVSQRGLHA